MKLQAVWSKTIQKEELNSAEMNYAFRNSDSSKSVHATENRFIPWQVWQSPRTFWSSKSGNSSRMQRSVSCGNRSVSFNLIIIARLSLLPAAATSSSSKQRDHPWRIHYCRRRHHPNWCLSIVGERALNTLTLTYCLASSYFEQTNILLTLVSWPSGILDKIHIYSHTQPHPQMLLATRWTGCAPRSILESWVSSSSSLSLMMLLFFLWHLGKRREEIWKIWNNCLI